jgi:hypothetical protein
MSADTLLSNRNASQIFFLLVRGRAKTDRVAKACKLKKAEAIKLLDRMVRVGILEQTKGSYGIDWERFLPVFLRQAMNIYAVAMPWKYIPKYLEKGEEDFIEASCARAERELARVKVKLAANDLFFKVVQSYFTILVTEMAGPQDYMEDLRVSDAIDEFEYALLKIQPMMRRQKRKTKQAKELFRLLSDWYRQIQGYDTPTGSALRAAFMEHGLV